MTKKTKISDILLAIALTLVIFSIAKLTTKKPEVIENNIIVIDYHPEEIERDVYIRALIIKIAEENNFDVNTALRIAKCESSYGTNMFNPSSSAKGIYQWINRTWENYCEGDVLNDRDNIECFIKYYKDKPHWWECK